MLGDMIDLKELLKRAIKYVVEGLMVALVAYSIPKRSLNLDEIALIALTAAATFSILDTYVPSMATKPARVPDSVLEPTLLDSSMQNF